MKTQNISTAKVEKMGRHFFVTVEAGMTDCGMYINRDIVSKPYKTEDGAHKFMARYNKMIGA